MKERQYNTKAVVKKITTEGGYALEEIHDIKEGDEIIGTVQSTGEIFTFRHNGQPAVLYVGENCELIEVEMINLAVFNGDEVEFFDIEEKKQALEYAEQVEGELKYSVEYVNLKTNGITVLPFYSTSLTEARKKAYKEFIH